MNYANSHYTSRNAALHEMIGNTAFLIKISARIYFLHPLNTHFINAHKFITYMLTGILKMVMSFLPGVN